MFLLINFAVFQLAWLSSVLGGAMKMPWLGPVAVLVALTIHFKAARRPFEEFVLVISCALIGAAFDSMLVAMAWVTYPAGLFSSFMAFGRTWMSASSGWIAQQTDWVTFFIISTFAAIPGLIMLLWMMKRLPINEQTGRPAKLSVPAD